MKKERRSATPIELTNLIEEYREAEVEALRILKELNRLTTHPDVGRIRKLVIGAPLRVFRKPRESR